MKRWLVLVGLWFVCQMAAGAAAMPDDSIYQLDIRLTDQSGHTTLLSERQGRVQLVSMFYTSCTMVCPMIVDSMKLTSEAVGAPLNDRMDRLLVSFDPDRDSAATLQAYAARRKLDAPRWTLARVNQQDARQLAALLGLQYRQLPDGDFNHSSELILLDTEGRIVARTSVVGRLDPDFVARIRRLLASP